MIGFFRSFTSRQPIIEEADEIFIRQNFPSGPFLFLTLQPSAPENCMADFRFFQNGQLLPRIDDPAFPFDPSRLPMAEAPAPPDRGKSRSARRGPRARALSSSASAASCRSPPLAVVDSRHRLHGRDRRRSGSCPDHLKAQSQQWTDLHLDARPAGGLLEVNGSRRPARRRGVTADSWP